MLNLMSKGLAAGNKNATAASVLVNIFAEDDKSTSTTPTTIDQNIV